MLSGAPGLGAVAEVATPEGAQDLPPWFTVDAGGGTSSAKGLTLTGTIGQPELGVSEDVPAQLVLIGGFWASAPSAVTVFVDGFESGDTAEWSQEVP